MTPPSKKPVNGTYLHILDEHAFMQEAAERINAFLATYPREARYVLSAFIQYKHELAEVYAAIPDRTKPPGVTIGGLMAGILQTHHGTGYYLKPIIGPDEEYGMVIVKVEVARQQEEDVADAQS